MTDSETLSVKRYQVLSGSALKLIACISMLSDHLAKFYLYRFAWATKVWFTIARRTISLDMLMQMFGRFAFPIFAFLLVVGFEHTHSRMRYGLSLFVLALISEVPFNLMIGQSLFFPAQNVAFTWLLGLIALSGLTYFEKKPVIALAILVVLFVISRYLHADGRTEGYLFILLMYGLRKENLIRCVAPPILLQMKAMVFLSLVLTLFYNGQRGFIKTPFLKYCFYAFYPVHMLVIYLIAR
jgi:hypothetical protein